MKIRADILRMYKDIHSWVGITAGLALFVAFYAGAITMFESPLQNWATRPVPVSSVALEKHLSFWQKFLQPSHRR